MNSERSIFYLLGNDWIPCLSMRCKIWISFEYDFRNLNQIFELNYTFLFLIIIDINTLIDNINHNHRTRIVMKCIGYVNLCFDIQSVILLWLSKNLNTLSVISKDIIMEKLSTCFAFSKDVWIKHSVVGLVSNNLIKAISNPTVIQY